MSFSSRVMITNRFVEVFLQAGPKLVPTGIWVTIAPMAIGYLFGRKALGLNPIVLLDAITSGCR